MPICFLTQSNIYDVTHIVSIYSTQYLADIKHEDSNV